MFAPNDEVDQGHDQTDAGKDSVAEDAVEQDNEVNSTTHVAFPSVCFILADKQAKSGFADD